METKIKKKKSVVVMPYNTFSGQQLNVMASRWAHSDANVT